MASKMLIIRLNGGGDIGFGHLFRCLAIVESTRNGQESDDCVFLINNHPAVVKILQDRGYSHRVIEHGQNILSVWIDMKTNYPQIRSVLLDIKDDCSSEIESLKQMGIFVTLMDNSSKARLFADQNIYPVAHAQPEKMDWRGYQGRVVGGSAYVPIGRPFIIRQANAAPLKNREKIMVTMGGADPNRITLRIMDSLASIATQVPIQIVLGLSCQFTEDAIEKNTLLNNVYEIVVGTSQMPDLMSEAGLAVTALGTTIHELLFMGVPVVVVNNFEDDADASMRLEELGAIQRFGYFKNIRWVNFADSIEELWENGEQREMMTKNLIFNGNGGKNIKRILETKV